MNRELKKHWEYIYSTKQPHEVSWTQKVPETSLEFIRNSGMPKNAHIIDVGGGDSLLVDHLLDNGYENITVLDISANSLERARKRLGKRGEQVKWVVTNVLDFQPEHKYDIWHDRAAFHFLTDNEDIQQYVDLTSQYVKSDIVLGTFSEDGPEKCSGLKITNYNEEGLALLLRENFKKNRCITIDHVTPFQTSQNFLFCSFSRK